MAAKAVVGILLGLGLVACEPSNQQPVVAGQSATATAPQAGAAAVTSPAATAAEQATAIPATAASTTSASTTSASTTSASATNASTATVPITLNERDFQNYGLDTNALSYSFQFLTVTSAAPIQFQNGTAQINIPGVPANQPGTATLQILQSGAVVMSATQPSVVLQPGSSQLSFQLQPANGSSATLTINTTVTQGANPGGVGTNPPGVTTPTVTTPSTVTNGLLNTTPAGSNPLVSTTPTVTNPSVVNTTPTVTPPPAVTNGLLNTTPTVTSPPVINNPTIPGQTTPPGQTTVPGQTTLPGQTVVTNPPASGGSQPTVANPNGLSFARDVAPILNRSCTECHHPGGRTPDLTAPPQQATVALILSIAGPGGQMPPSPRDPLSQSDLTTISNWASGGMNP